MAASRVRRLWLHDFRSYATAEIPLAPGLTVIAGGNGEGKTNILEALGFLATLSSFRGAASDVMVRTGATTAVVRADCERDGRDVLIEAELARAGRTRVQVNRQRLNRARDLLGAIRVTVFAPDDLDLVKGGPAGRRRYLDELLVALHPKNDALQREVDRVLKQRNALLRQVGGRLDEAAASTLDVWDSRLAIAGEKLAHARTTLVERLAPALAAAHAALAGPVAAEPRTRVSIRYDAAWRAEGLAAALAAARRDELRRGVSLVGPHRDDLALDIGEQPARTHASQGEQRTLALALRLAGHAMVTEIVGSAPVLLLDDVFSELDADRSRALLGNLPSGQAVLTTAAGVPAGAVPDLMLRVKAGTVVEG